MGWILGKLGISRTGRNQEKVQAGPSKRGIAWRNKQVETASPKTSPDSYQVSNAERMSYENRPI